MKLIRLLVFLLVASAAPAGRAFEGHEHAAMGIYGLAWARVLFAEDDKHDPRTIAEVNRQVKDFLNSHDETGKPHKLATYGDLVEVVDFVNNPNECLVLGREPEIPADEQRELERASRRRVMSKLSSILAWADASHNNNDHFQQRAMDQYRMWHAEAVALAGRDDQLWKALWCEAFANHFLQDMMAPGHVRTPRRLHLVDVAAVALHDHFNDKGEMLHVNPSGLPLVRLRELKSQLLDPAADAALGPTKSDQGEKLTAEDLEHLQILERAAEIRMFGDGHLTKKPDGSSNADQKMFLIALTARSILDVLESHAALRVAQAEAKSKNTPQPQPTLVNSFQRQNLQWWTGDYSAHPQVRRWPWSEVIIERVTLQTPAGHYRIEHGDEDHRDTIPAKFVPSIEANYQSLFAHGSGADRVEVNAALLTGAWITLRNKEINQYGLLLGYSTLLDQETVRKGDVLAHGPLVKLVVPLPQVNAQCYAFGGWRRYYESDYVGTHGFGGLGVETGFSFLYLRLNISAESFIENHRLRTSPALTFGIGGTITWDRLRAAFR